LIRHFSAPSVCGILRILRGLPALIVFLIRRPAPKRQICGFAGIEVRFLNFISSGAFRS